MKRSDDAKSVGSIITGTATNMGPVPQPYFISKMALDLLPTDL